MPEEHKKHLKPVVEEVVEEKPEEPPTEAPKEEVAPVEEKKVEARKMNLKLVVAITVVSSLVAAVVSGGVYVYLSGVENVKPIAETTSTPSATATPEPTEAPVAEAVDLSGYSVRVLNGSGAIGAAGAGEDILVEAGFTVSATGNASNYNFKATVIQAKSTVAAEAISVAKEALEEADYKVELGDALPSDTQYDIVVTVGPN